jgi:N utilization substance protein A
LQIASEKGLPREAIIGAIESALTATYKRTFGTVPEVQVRLNEHTGEFKVLAEKKVVIDVTDPRTQISLKQAAALPQRPGIGEVVEVELEEAPKEFGRIAAQTARQVIMQRINEAERDRLYEEFSSHEDDIVSGIVQQIDKARGVILEVGRTEVLLPIAEQAHGEHYRVGQRLKVLVTEIHKGPRGLQVTASRTNRHLVKRLFEMEVPEIFSGAVEIKSIAREPGVRTKVAVAARQDGVDPVGACVGQRGVRIQNVVNEMNNEKIDVLAWSADPRVYVANALRPATVLSVTADDGTKSATVVVPDRELSLAIGKDGQNARLAARLTGWRIDIKKASDVKAAAAAGKEG